MDNQLILHTENSTKNTNDLQLSKIILKDDYVKEWNIYLNDFVCLTRNGELIRNTLYRIGGINSFDLKKDKYFMLLKYVEAYYSKDILKMSKSSKAKHLESRWCILDSDGNEKVEFKSFQSAYLIKNSCIYTYDNNYYNIETKELYCNAYKSIQTENYLLLDNAYDKDELKRGVMKINKKTGEFEIIN